MLAPAVHIIPGINKLQRHTYVSIQQYTVVLLLLYAGKMFGLAGCSDVPGIHYTRLSTIDYLYGWGDGRGLSLIHI